MLPTPGISVGFWELMQLRKMMQLNECILLCSQPGRLEEDQACTEYHHIWFQIAVLKLVCEQRAWEEKIHETIETAKALAFPDFQAEQIPMPLATGSAGVLSGIRVTGSAITITTMTILLCFEGRIVVMSESDFTWLSPVERLPSNVLTLQSDNATVNNQCSAQADNTSISSHQSFHFVHI